MFGNKFVKHINQLSEMKNSNNSIHLIVSLPISQHLKLYLDFPLLRPLNTPCKSANWPFPIQQDNNKP